MTGDGELLALYCFYMTELLLQQSKTIEELTKLCKELTNELAQYKCVEAEEIQLKKLIQEGNAYEDITS